MQNISNSDAILGAGSGQKESIFSYLLHIIPSNIFDPFIKNDFLQIILCALLFSFAVLKTENSAHSKKILSFFELFKKIFTRLIFVFSKVSPLGTFGITAWIVTSQDFNFIKSMTNEY
jgi:aerobic C4-dicarboxylate transport protein